MNKSSSAVAPPDFRERIDFWRDVCGLPTVLHERMHRLRVWRNASEHHDHRRWRTDGPKGVAEFEALVKQIHVGVAELERRG